MMFSRFIVGVHSANQLLYGFLIGIVTVLLCVQVIRPKIYEWLSSKPVSSWRISVIFAVLFLLTIIVTLYVEYVDDGFSITDKEQQILQKCLNLPQTQKITKVKIESQIFMGGFAMMGSGIYTGISVWYNILEPKLQQNEIIQDDESISFKFARLLIKGLFLIFPILLALPIYMLKDQIGQPILSMTIGAAIPGFLIGLILFSNIDVYILSKSHVLKMNHLELNQ